SSLSSERCPVEREHGVTSGDLTEDFGVGQLLAINAALHDQYANHVPVERAIMLLVVGIQHRNPREPIGREVGRSSLHRPCMEADHPPAAAESLKNGFGLSFCHTSHVMLLLR